MSLKLGYNQKTFLESIYEEITEQLQTSTLYYQKISLHHLDDLPLSLIAGLLMKEKDIYNR